ncbi:MAG: hypothetical protein AUK23_06720 [Deltaproteobacteria bacterium CG2_30_43_15]|nr:MAG: hypothetical protein AUK23_06720 [Deltaproteobacteria bacterium CG2_30_43_15]
MKSHRFDLSFVDPKERGFPASPRAQIYVKTHSSDEKGRIYVTPICASLFEFEAQCNLLTKEIESIRKKAQRKYKTK